MIRCVGNVEQEFSTQFMQLYIDNFEKPLVQRTYELYQRLSNEIASETDCCQFMARVR